MMKSLNDILLGTGMFLILFILPRLLTRRVRKKLKRSIDKTIKDVYEKIDEATANIQEYETKRLTANGDKYLLYVEAIAVETQFIAQMHRIAADLIILKTRA